MDRLSSLDAEFLHIEDADAPAHIAGLCLMEGPPPSIAQLRRLISERMHLIPRYRQRLDGVPLGLGRPTWVDDPDFRLANHVRRRRVPAPGGPDDLDRLVESLLEPLLDRSRPLWQLWLLDNLADDRWAVLGIVHHCLTDGVAGMQLLEALFDVEPDAPASAPEPWDPSDAPNGLRRIVDAWTGFAGDLGSWAAGLAGDATHPLRLATNLAGQASGVARLLSALRPTPPSSIEGSVGPRRTWGHTSVRLADISTIRRQFGGTANDVLLAATTAGYRELLAAHGDDLDCVTIRSAIPVSVRAGEEGGNRVAAMVLDLPVHIADPVERLVVVTEQMTALKASHETDATAALTHVADLIPPLVISTATRWAIRIQHAATQRSITTIVTNVPGPQFPLYSLGRQMVEFVPYLGLSQGIRVITAIASYDGSVAIAATGDAASVPDAGIVATVAAREISTLRQLASETAKRSP